MRSLPPEMQKSSGHDGIAIVLQGPFRSSSRSLYKVESEIASGIDFSLQTSPL